MLRGALGRCCQSLLDGTRKTVDKGVNEDCRLAQIFCRFIPGFCSKLRYQQLMDRVALGNRHAYQNDAEWTQYRHFLRARQSAVTCPPLLMTLGAGGN